MNDGEYRASRAEAERRYTAKQRFAQQRATIQEAEGKARPMAPPMEPKWWRDVWRAAQTAARSLIQWKRLAGVLLLLWVLGVSDRFRDPGWLIVQVALVIAAVYGLIESRKKSGGDSFGMALAIGCLVAAIVAIFVFLGNPVSTRGASGFGLR